VEIRSRVRIGKIPIDAVTMKDAVQQVYRHLASDKASRFIVSGVNAHFINTAQNEARFASYLSDSNLNVADGESLVLASRLMGLHLPQRVTGIDLMIELCGMAATSDRSVYLLGGKPGAAEKAANQLCGWFPKLKIVGVDRPPFGRESDPMIVEAIRSRIRDARPDLLFVCFGVPHQEYWIQAHALDLPVRVVMGNGAAFDVLAGYFHRPPKWMQCAGLEWLYRFCAEPFRLWKRYLVGNLQFVGTVMQQQYEMRQRIL